MSLRPHSVVSRQVRVLTNPLDVFQLYTLTSMKREMLIIAWSVSLNTSLQVRTLPGGLGSSACLDRKLERSFTVQPVLVS